MSPSPSIRTWLPKRKADLATTKSDLPLVVNDYVAAFINFFANTQKGHNTLLHSFQRSGRYKGMIQRVMAEEGVPQDLIYLAVAESGFQPRAINRALASRRHVAVHALRQLRPDAQRVSWMSASIRRNRPALTPAT